MRGVVAAVRLFSHRDTAGCGNRHQPAWLQNHALEGLHAEGWSTAVDKDAIGEAGTVQASDGDPELRSQAGAASCNSLAHPMDPSN